MKIRTLVILAVVLAAVSMLCAIGYYSWESLVNILGYLISLCMLCTAVSFIALIITLMISSITIFIKTRTLAILTVVLTAVSLIGYCSWEKLDVLNDLIPIGLILLLCLILLCMLCAAVSVIALISKLISNWLKMGDGAPIMHLVFNIIIFIFGILTTIYGFYDRAYDNDDMLPGLVGTLTLIYVVPAETLIFIVSATIFIARFKKYKKKIKANSDENNELQTSQDGE